MRKRFDNSQVFKVPTYAITKILTSPLPAKPFMQEKFTVYKVKKQQIFGKTYGQEWAGENFRTTYVLAGSQIVNEKKKKKKWQ